jgi:hypothetical protein
MGWVSSLEDTLEDASGGYSWRTPGGYLGGRPWRTLLEDTRVFQDVLKGVI